MTVSDNFSIDVLQKDRDVDCPGVRADALERRNIIK